MRSFTIITAFILPFLAVHGWHPMYLRLPGHELLHGCNIYDPLNRQNHPDGNVTVEIFSRRHRPRPSHDQERSFGSWRKEGTISSPSRRADYSTRRFQECLVDCRRDHRCKSVFAALDAEDDDHDGFTDACLLYKRPLTIDDFEVVESGWTYGRAGNLACDHEPPTATNMDPEMGEEDDEKEQKMVEVCV